VRSNWVTTQDSRAKAKGSQSRASRPVAFAMAEFVVPVAAEGFDASMFSLGVLSLLPESASKFIFTTGSLSSSFSFSFNVKEEELSREFLLVLDFFLSPVILLLVTICNRDNTYENFGWVSG